MAATIAGSDRSVNPYRPPGSNGTVCLRRLQNRPTLRPGRRTPPGARRRGPIHRPRAAGESSDGPSLVEQRRTGDRRLGDRHAPDRAGQRTAERGVCLRGIRPMGAGAPAGTLLGLHRHRTARAGSRRCATGRVRRRAADHAARARRRGARLPQRVQPPGHDADGKARAATRHHPLPLPLLDLRS